jgi:hypothetical protein
LAEFLRAFAVIYRRVVTIEILGAHNMRPMPARSRSRRAISVVVAVAWLGFPAGLRAEVKEVAFEDLANRSELIVVARVSKVEDGPQSLKRMDESMPPLKVATAQVTATWKGAPVGEVRYVASRSWVCDTSHAEKGERVVLFLERRNDSDYWSITHVGRGRMPLREVGAKTFAALQREVILPKGTPTLSEKKTLQVTLPPTEPGKQYPGTFTLPYTATSIELGVLRGLVRSSGRRN